MTVVQRDRHRNLATVVASASFVLLKNMNSTLPIKSEGSNKAIVVSKYISVKCMLHKLKEIHFHDV